ncbi:DUF58 domain-containing protein [Paracoccus sp. TK19116]|uniref:DUF58 domain-containing protein n=1 Tax=Paracoccus albicereus TaxID=2922394 RepID=A0ABT1MMQ2_9RHOB|nr:DUF58 domain-containing protein [Paracoccus albicereus]MCQ0969545.1 DUF58 domain-containing protein [Paracoccus albicereus]
MSLPRASGAVLSLDRLVALGNLAAARATPGRARGPAGGLSGPRRGEGGDLFDLRPWQQGDDLRRIDPAATARSGRPQVRSRHEDVERTLMLVADFRRSTLWGTRGRFRSVAGAEALALEGWRAVRAGGRVGVVVVGDRTIVTVSPQPREAAMLRVAATLAECHATALGGAEAGQESLSALLDAVIERVAAGSAVVLATGLDDLDTGFRATALALMRFCTLEVLLVQDAVETDPPQGSVLARIGRRVARGRFASSRSADLLDGQGIPYRLIRAETSMEDDAA